MSDLITLRTRLRKRIGNPTVAAVPDADLTQVINDAYGEIATKYKFHKVRKLCTFDTVVDQQKYGLPTDCYAVLRVRDTTNKIKLEKAGDRTAATDDATASAKPTSYVRQRDWIALYPTPDDIYTMELFYKAKPTDLSADVDYPVLPGAWDEGLLRLARFYYWDSIGDLPKATYAQTLYDKWVSDMPLEFDDEADVIDSGVEIPTLGNSQDKGLDFDHSP